MSDDTTLHGGGKPRAGGVLGRKALLVVVSPEEFGRVYIVRHELTVIGRSVDCDFRLEDPRASREHCRIRVDEHQSFILEDLGSSNRTYVNRKKVRRKTELLYGDRVLIGDTVLRFFHEENVDRK
jgi:pSer/pThr/pTyr-binding forkhead associated (FHA) protein